MEERWILESSRLLFRELREADFEALRPILGDKNTMYAWGYGFSDLQITEWIEKNKTRYQRDGFSYYAAILRETGALVGMMGLLNEEIGEETLLGIGYILGSDHWGYGLATEGAGAFLEYAFSVLKAAAVIADIRPENAASRHVAERLGMQVVGRHVKHHNGEKMPHLIYSVSAGDFRERQSSSTPTASASSQPAGIDHQIADTPKTGASR